MFKFHAHRGLTAVCFWRSFCQAGCGVYHDLFKPSGWKNIFFVVSVLLAYNRCYLPETSVAICSWMICIIPKRNLDQTDRLVGWDSSHLAPHQRIYFEFFRTMPTHNQNRPSHKRGMFVSNPSHFAPCQETRSQDYECLKYVCARRLKGMGLELFRTMPKWDWDWYWSRTGHKLTRQSTLEKTLYVQFLCCISTVLTTFFSARLGDQNVQDSGASFSGWSESNDPLGEAEEQVLSLLLAESASYDPLLDNIDWGDETYTGPMNLNPDWIVRIVHAVGYIVL